MQHFAPRPSDLTSEQILFLRSLRHTPEGTPANLQDLCDIALGHRFKQSERHEALVELARVYERLMISISGVDPLGDLLGELALWAETRRFDDDQDPALDTPDERVVRAYMRWQAMR